MFDFDDIDLQNYTYTYPTPFILQRKYDIAGLRGSTQKYIDFCINIVKGIVASGSRMYGNDEQEWIRLRYYIIEIENNMSVDNDALIKAFILLDQAYILLYEGREAPYNTQ